MDYHRIYDQFIADRRAKEAGLTGYVERHHIVPRCLGGDDSDANLVALTPSDHFFAHLLLAKAHGTPLLWGAVRLMAGLLSSASPRAENWPSKAETIRRRRRYGVIKKWANRRMRGASHPMADPTVYEFQNVDGRRFSGTRSAFIKAYGVPMASLCTLFSKKAKTKSAYGWYRPDRVPSGIIGREAVTESQRDRAILRYRHFDGREVEGDRAAMAKLTGLTVGNIGMLITGKIKVAGGWQVLDGRELVSEDHLRTDGVHNPRYDSTVYEFVHDDGRTEKCTMNEAAAKYGNRPKWTPVAQGIGTYKGWRLKGANLKRSTKGRIRHFVNRDGRKFIGTQTEFRRAQGLTDAPVWMLVHRSATTLCGWRLDADAERTEEVRISKPGTSGKLAA